MDLQISNFQGSVSNSPEVLEKFSRDASIFEVTPTWVVFPKVRSDVEALVSFATSERKLGNPVSLTASVGRTDMTGGSLSRSIIVDFTKHLNQIGEIEDIGGFPSIAVQPGAFYRDFEKIVSSKGLMMPSFPASKSICGIGGMVGNNSGGELSFVYGQTKRYVKELRVVLADGNSYTLSAWNKEQLFEVLKQDNFLGEAVRKLWALISENKDTISGAKPSTSKNSSGYYLWDVWDGKHFDLTQLFTGSQGTLGIITDIRFKLVPIQPEKQLLVLFLSDTGKIGEAVEVLKKFSPESLELFDDHTLRLAMRFAPDIAKKMGASSLKLLWQFLPEFWMVVTSGLPKIVILAEFAGKSKDLVFKSAVGAQNSLAKVSGVKSHLTRNAAEASKYWTVRHESFNLLRQHAHGKVSSPFVEDIIVHPEQLGDFLPELNAIFAKYPDFEYTVAGHAGDANLHIIPFVDLKDPEKRVMVERLSLEVYRLIHKYKGSITAEHNDGISHGVYLHTMFSPEVLELFRQTKRIFDPLDIFNPGKKIEASMKDFENYMRKG